MIVHILHKDGTEKAVSFTETDQFARNNPPTNKLILTKDGYDMELSGFVNDNGEGNAGNNISLHLSVRATGDPLTAAKIGEFNVNVAKLEDIVIDFTTFVPHFYLGQALPVGNDEIAAAGILVKGRFEGKSEPQPLPRNMKLTVQWVANEPESYVNESGYADIGGTQTLKVNVIGWSPPSSSNSSDSPPYTIPVTVHILDNAPGNAYASGKSYDVKYIDTPQIGTASIQTGIGIGTGPFSKDRLSLLSQPINIPSFLFGQYEVTYELWYAVYMWARENGYKFSDWNGTIHTGLGILKRDGAKGTRPTAEGNDKYMPVHGLDWADAIVWCNAYHELLHEISGSTSALAENSYPYLSSESSPIKDVASLSPNTVKPNSSSPAYRLPSETEWEVAVRGGGSNSGAWRATYAGKLEVDEVAWYYKNSGDLAHSSSEAKAPLVIGSASFYNMSGNVWEWCQSDDSDKTETPYYLKRGGAYNDSADDCSNNTGRSKDSDKDTDQDTGFRLAKTTS
jgi:formylglycine-generating enzyme required for sulfatase activity